MAQNKDDACNLGEEAATTELRELIARAKQGDSAAVPRLREHLLLNPHLWRHTGDLAIQSQAAWIRRIAGDDKHLQEVTVQRINAMKSELSENDSSPLENLLIERIVSTWVQLYYHETRAALEEEKGIKWAEFRQKQTTAAADAHTKSIAALATFRKLLPNERKTENPLVNVVENPRPNSDLLTNSDSGESAQPRDGSRIIQLAVYPPGRSL